jgi:hypothetical protein
MIHIIINCPPELKGYELDALDLEGSIFNGIGTGTCDAEVLDVSLPIHGLNQHDGPTRTVDEPFYPLDPGADRVLALLSYNMEKLGCLRLCVIRREGLEEVR